jgi:hypothetical protein
VAKASLALSTYLIDHHDLSLNFDIPSKDKSYCDIHCGGNFFETKATFHFIPCELWNDLE